MATATAPQETTSFHPWPDLPTELQLEVLGHALTFSEPIDKDTSHQAVSLLIPVLRCGNTELAALARESYYKSNKFVSRVPLFLTSFPRFPPLDACKWIRRFEVTFNLYTSRPNDQNLDMDTAWRVLAASTQTTPSQDVTHEGAILQAIRRSTNWQMRFPNLYTFYLNLKIRTDPTDLVRYYLSRGKPSPPTFRCILDFKDAVLDALRHCEHRMQAKEVVVRVYCEGCRNVGLSQTQPARVTEHQISAPPCTCEHELAEGLAKVFGRG